MTSLSAGWQHATGRPGTSRGLLEGFLEEVSIAPRDRYHKGGEEMCLVLLPADPRDIAVLALKPQFRGLGWDRPSTKGSCSFAGAAWGPLPSLGSGRGARWLPSLERKPGAGLAGWRGGGWGVVRFFC